MIVTQSEAFEDWRQAMGIEEIVEDPDAQTAEQLAEMFGVSLSTARRYANDAVKAGRMEKIRVKRDRQPQDAWRLVE
jgi:transposase